MKIQTVEETQLPRWVYAMMRAKAEQEDPDAPVDDSGDLKHRTNAQIKATEFYKQRLARMAEMKEQQGTSSRYSGLEWKTKRPNKFTSEELDKILPTRRVSYVMNKSFFLVITGTCIAVATAITLFFILAVCAEIKLNGGSSGEMFGSGFLQRGLEAAGTAWDMFTASPVDYFHRVMNALDL